MNEIARRKIGAAELALIFSIFILVVVVAVPIILIFTTAFFENGKFNLAGVLKILNDPDTYQALLNSLVIATGTTI
ncbi:MAG: iron ABC transporter permease, partial [Spirochaetaceae bacterium]|nr:iron ABC transporter permease [Spirochaetaceae bacterium]